MKGQEDFDEKRREAWDMVRKSIDAGIPCYGWEMESPEFYVIKGYDDTGYYYSGPIAEPIKGPKPWQELGASGTGIVEVYSVTRGNPADDAVTLKQSLEFALEHASAPPKWHRPGYKTGLAAYDTWIQTIADGKANALGMAYNAAVWAECRSYGVQFLQEAHQRLNGNVRPRLNEAITDYSQVAASLNALVDLFPMFPAGEIEDRERLEKAIGHLKTAREAESKSLMTFEKLAAVL